MAKRLSIFCLLTVVYALGDLAILQAQTAIQVVAVSGDTDPNGDGTLFIPEPPAINNAGQVAFQGRFSGTTTVLLGNANGFSNFYREGDIGPGGVEFLNPFDVAINDNGQVAFSGSLFTPAFDQQLFRYDNATGLTRLAGEGDPAPGGNGTLSNFTFDQGFDFNSLGQVSFLSRVENTAGGRNDDWGIFRSDGGGIIEIAREGSPGPGTDEQFRSLIGFSNFPMNNNGQVAFFATSESPIENFTILQDSIFVGDGTAPATAIERVGDPIIGRNETIGSLAGPPSGINDQGDVLFSAEISNISLSDGLFRSNGNGVTAIVIEGDATPDGGETFDLINDASINDAGQVLFRSTLSTENSHGIFLGDGNSPLESIAQTGEAAPDGNGVFARFDFGFPESVALNNNGDVAFAASLTSTSAGTGDTLGIFFEGENGLIQIARTGDAMLGSTIERLRIGGSSAPRFRAQSGLNDFGQVAFSFRLADGRDGIAIASTNGGLLGDVSLNGVVDFLDIAPFIAHLSSQTYQFEADIDEDGDVDFMDIAPFIGLLSGS